MPPLIKAIRLLAAKVEATSGTLETLTAAEATVPVFDVEIQPDISMTDRPATGAFGALAAVTEGRAGKLKFKTEITGNGAAGVPAWASTLLPMCGWVEDTTTFSPIAAPPGTSGVKTGTMAVYLGPGLIKKMRGCAGTFTIDLTTGKFGMIDWEFTGVWVAPADGTILAPTYTTYNPIRVANATFTLGSWSPCIESLKVDAGNEVTVRPCPTNSDSSGLAAAIIVNRFVTAKLNPESVLVATADPHGDWLARTSRALSFSYADTLDRITIAAPATTVVGVQEGDRSGVVIDEIDLSCNNSAAIGNDQLTIDFGAP